MTDEEIRADERAKLVKMFKTEAALAWGGDATWITTGTNVANLAAEWVENA